MNHTNKIVAALCFFVSAFCHAETHGTSATVNFNGLNLSRYGGGLTDLEISFSIPDDAINLSPGTTTHGVYEADFSISANSQSTPTRGWVQFRDLLNSSTGYLDGLFLTIPLYSGDIPGVNINTKIYEIHLDLFSSDGDMLSSPLARDLSPLFAEQADDFRYWLRFNSWDGPTTLMKEMTSDSAATASFTSSITRFVVSVPEPTTTVMLFVGLAAVATAVRTKNRKVKLQEIELRS